MFSGRPQIFSAPRVQAVQQERSQVTRAIVGDAVIATDREGQVTYLNAAAETMTGWTQRDAQSQPLASVSAILDERTRQPLESPVAGVLQKERGMDLGNHAILVAKDGNVRPISGSLAPIQDSTGMLLGMVLVFRDVTEQRLAQNDLRHSAARTNAILEAALDCIITMDHQGTVVEFNPASERTFGYPRADVIGRELADLIVPPSLREAHRKGLAHYLATGEARVLGKRIELDAMRSDGSQFPVELAITRIPTDGQPMFTAYLRDISDRRWIEQLRNVRLTATQQLMQAADVEEAALGVLRSVCENLGWDIGFFWTVNQKDDVLECIGTWRRQDFPAMTFAHAGCSRTFERGEGLPGRVWSSGRSAWILDVRHDPNFPRAAFAATEGLHSAFACPILVRDKALGVIEFFTQRIRETDAELLETMATVARQVGQFIERRQAEAALHQGEEKLRLLADTIPQLAWMAHSDGHIFWYNRRWYEYTGKTAEEMEDWGWRSVHDPALLDQVLERWQGSIACGEAFEMVFPLRGADQLFRPFLTRVNPLRDQMGRIVYWCGTNTDISDIKRLEEALRDADRRKDEFLATLAHELRNPLAPISNSLQVLKMPRVDAATAQQTRDIMERQIHHLVRLVDDLLDVSRVMRGKIELRKEPVELATVVARAVETALPLIEAQAHRLDISLPDEAMVVDADPVRLVQVVGNLLANAAKYTGANGHIEVSARILDGDAVLRVRDNGIGIAPDMLAQVFDLFVQAENAATRSQGGLGIGLTLVKNLLEMHDGTVEVHSAGLGRGCEFKIRLPLLTQRREEPAVFFDPKDAAPSSGQRLLVVDDNMDAAESLALLLRLQGHEVRVAYDGTSAIDVARLFRPALIFLDLGMPRMDGYEVLRRVRKTRGLEDTVVAALTGWGLEEDRRRTADAGFDHHLVKPPHANALEDLLSSLEQGNR
ncbi:MAG: PAS domain S-box protein [Lautropia sp.]